MLGHKQKLLGHVPGCAGAWLHHCAPSLVPKLVLHFRPSADYYQYHTGDTDSNPRWVWIPRLASHACRRTMFPLGQDAPTPRTCGSRTSRPMDAWSLSPARTGWYQHHLSSWGLRIFRKSSSSTLTSGWHAAMLCFYWPNSHNQVVCTVLCSHTLTGKCMANEICP